LKTPISTTRQTTSENSTAKFIQTANKVHLKKALTFSPVLKFTDVSLSTDTVFSKVVDIYQCLSKNAYQVARKWILNIDFTWLPSAGTSSADGIVLIKVCWAFENKGTFAW